MRHLLTHTSGIDGDVFTDTGRGDDCLEKYVALLDEAAQNHPLGATWSYCNSGFSLAGRVIEKLTGGTWDAAIARAADPPARTRAHRHAARGGDAAPRRRRSRRRPGAEPTRAPSAWGLPRSVGPAGPDQRDRRRRPRWARVHLNGGAAADGTRVLSEASTAAMTANQADVPDKYILGDSWGIGLDPVRLGRPAPDRARREHARPGGVPARAARRRPGGHAAHERWQHPRPVRGSVPRDLRRARRGRDAAAAPPPAEPASVDLTPYLGTYERASVTPRRARAGRASRSADGAHRPARRARAGDRCTSTR